MGSLKRRLIKAKKIGFFHYLRHCMVVLSRITCKTISQTTTNTLLKFYQHLNLKDYIVLECESDMDDNPRAVYEYLLKTKWNNKHRIIWLVKNVEKCKELYSEKNVVFLNRNDLSTKNIRTLNYYLAVSKWLIFSHPYWFRKQRNNQVVVNIGHGNSFKRKAHSAKDLSNTYDWLLVTSELSKKINQGFWGCPYEKMFICGYPRNDLLFTGKKESIFQALLENYSNEKVIMCMPTYKQAQNWSDSSLEDKYAIEVIRSVDELRSLNKWLFQHKMHMLVKIHPLQDLSILRGIDLTNIHYLVNKDLFEKRIILYELLGCCDALVTDLSSVYLDYLMLNRPIGFLMNSVLDYKRGYNIENPEDYMPGERIFCYEDLLMFLNDFSLEIDKFSTQRERINSMFNPAEQENTRKFIDILLHEFSVNN